MHQNLGTCTYVLFSSLCSVAISTPPVSSIKIGTLSQTPEQILANLKSALPAVVSRVKGGWSEIQSFHIKTNSSVSLPIWTCSLDEGEHGRWAEPSRGEKVAGGVEDSKLEADEEAAEQTQQKVKGAKGAKPGSAVTGSSEKAKSGEKSATKSRKGSESAVTKEPSLTPMRAEAIEASKVDSKGVPVDGVIAGNKRKRKGDLTNPVPAKLSVDSHIAKMPTANNALPHSSSSAAGEDPQIKPKKKKGKGSKATSTQTSDEASIAEGPQIKPKKKGKGSKATTTQTSDEASIAEAPRAYSPSVPVLPPPPQTSKKGKSETGARSDGPPVALSQGGVKEKRRNETGEKRKQKVVKAKAGAGAGAKDVVLGRKPGRVS
jgi:ribosome biogenesis protein UTP30